MSETTTHLTYILTLLKADKAEGGPYITKHFPAEEMVRREVAYTRENHPEIQVVSVVKQVSTITRTQLNV